MNSVPIFINAANGLCSLGNDLQAIEQALFGPVQNYLTLCDAYSSASAPDALPMGLVQAELADVTPALENTRNNRLLAKAVAPLRPQIEALLAQYGAQRVAVIVGTSTSGISDGELAIETFLKDGALPGDYSYAKQEISAPARFLATHLGVQGPYWAVSSACTSGGKVMVSAARLLRSGMCDAVVVAGVDSLCRMTVGGFSALGVTSREHCKPFSRLRNGINIGEAAASFVMSREGGPWQLLGAGESSDAYHISAPEPEGSGAERAMRIALANAGISAEQVDYINFHGTATEQNDRMEGLASSRVFPQTTACGSTKALTGHTLGAAGALEALFCLLTLSRDDGRLPQHCWDGESDPALPELPGLATRQLPSAARIAMSNSFAFGGNNLSLIFVRGEQ